MTSKYNKTIDNSEFQKEINRLTNQLWKLIPMRENKEDWQKHLSVITIEIIGLNEIIVIDSNLLELLEILEGLQKTEVEFSIYRKLVFESISLLRKVIQE